MSELSDAIFGPAQAPVRPMKNVTPKPKAPKATPAPSNAFDAWLHRKPAPDSHPLQQSPSLASQAYAAAPKPVQDFLGNVSRGLNVPQAVAGNLLTAGEQANQRGQSVPSFIGDFLTGKFQQGNASPAIANARRLIQAGNWDELIRRYAMYGSEYANRERAKAGDVGAQLMVKHPTGAAVVSSYAPFLDPTTWVAGAGAGALAKTARLGAAAAATSAADVAASQGLGRLSTGLRRAATTARTAGTLDRFAPVKAAAEDVAREGGATSAQAANAAARARATAVNLANARRYGTGLADQALERIFGTGVTWTRPELHEMWRRIDNGTLTPVTQTFTPAIEKKIATTIPKYQKFMAAHEGEQIKAGALDPTRLVRGIGGKYTYAPRRGAWVDPRMNDLDQEIQDYIAEHRTSAGGGPAFRAGTAGQNVHRTFSSIAQGEFNGAQLNPEWNPLETLHSKIAQGYTNTRVAQSLKELEDLGLIQQPAVDSYGKAVSLRSDFVPHTDVGTTRTFGAPILRGGTRYHPAVGDLIENLTKREAANPAAGIGSALNRAASLSEVSDFLYHPAVNELPSIAASGALLRPMTFLRALRNPSQAIPQAIEKGAVLPHAGHNVAESFLPWSDLTKEEQVARAAGAPGRAVRAITSDPLYGSTRFGQRRVAGIEPRIAAATYAALEKRLGPDRAQEIVRQIVSEPENVAHQGLSQFAQFPAFVKSMARYWLPKLVRNPAIYQGAHAGVNVRNQSKGYGPQPSDFEKLIPDIVLGKNAKGVASVLSVPNPANRPLQIVDLLGNAATGNIDADRMVKAALNITNPGISTLGRLGYTTEAPAGPPNTYRLWDKDNPDKGDAAIEALKSLAGRYTPLRANPLQQPGTLVGLSPYERQEGTFTEPATRSHPARTVPRGAYAFGREKALREGNPYARDWSERLGIEALERDEKKARTVGNTKRAAFDHQKAKALYDLLLKWEKWGGQLQP